MRKILFRGQTRRYGERVTLAGTKLPSKWAYGGVFPQEKGGSFAIIYQQKPKIAKLPVYADTVSEFTGLFDSTKWDELTEQEQSAFLEIYSENEWKGKPIFEGDIVNFKTTAYHFKNCRIKYQACYARYVAVDNQGYEYPMDKNFEYKVVGNIYDNPELLKGRETEC